MDGWMNGFTGVHALSLLPSNDGHADGDRTTLFGIPYMHVQPPSHPIVHANEPISRYSTSLNLIQVRSMEVEFESNLPKTWRREDYKAIVDGG